MTYDQLMTKWPGLTPKAMKEFPAYVKWLREVDVEAVAWADDVIDNHTSYRRRSYPGQLYTWADCDDPQLKAKGLDPWIPMDPMPAGYFPKYLLRALLAVYYRAPDRLKKLGA